MFIHARKRSVKKVIEMETKLPHEVSELMCWDCGKRWIAVYPQKTRLKDLECPRCGAVGGAVKTGQTLEEE